MKKNELICKIVFDTNIFWTDSENKINGLNSNVKESVLFVKDNNLQENICLAVPELLVRERVKQTLAQIEVNISKIEAGANTLKDWGVSIPEKDYKKNYKKDAEQKIIDTLKSLDVEIISTPIIDQEKLIDRAIEKIPPFNSKQDEGFKDAIIWLTLLSDAKKCANYKYILCTKNLRQFNLEVLKTEFLEYNKSGLLIVGDLKELKELIDKEFNLDLKLKELNRTIGNNVKELIGDIMVEFNHEILKEKIMPGHEWFEPSFVYEYVQERPVEHDPVHHTISSSGKSKDDEVLVGYNFVGLTIEDINSLPEGNYEIRAQLKVRPRYKERKKSKLAHNMNIDMIDYATATEFISQPNYIFGNENYLIVFNYNINSQVIYLQSVEKGLITPF